MDSDLPPEINAPPVSPAPPPPPFNRPPPVIAPLPAPRPPSRGTGWKVFAVILFVLLAISVLVNFQYLVSTLTGNRVKLGHNNDYGPRLDEVTIRESSSTNKIVVIPVEGVISGDAEGQGGYSIVTLVKEELKRAQENDDVRAVLLKVNSPGGEVLASDDIAKAIKKFQIACPYKPVVVSMGSLAASGGYYISAPCDWIVANELTITGSIGVIMHGLNYRGLLDKIGVVPQVFKSGKFKDMLSPTKSPEETTPEERQMIQDLINETFGKFKSVVADGRRTSFEHEHGKMLSPDWQDYADGRILSGKEAYKLGFVDEVGDFDDAVDRAKQLAHIKKAELVTYQQTFDISSIFHMFGQSDAKAVKIELGVDLPKLHAGYLYFLSSTYLQ